VSGGDVGGGLSPETEELLRRARAGARMPAPYKRRLKGAVLARIAFASTASLVAGQATAVGLAAKTVVVLAIVGSLGASGYLALRPKRHAAPAPVVAARVEPPAVVLPVETTTPAPRRRVVERHVASRPVAPPPAADLAAETSLLRGADRALRAGDTATAVSLLDEHAARFPKGALAPERAAERLIVACEVGVAEPRRVEQFLATHPGAPLAARVRRACTKP
jgi:hypothetical protein